MRVASLCYTVEPALAGSGHISPDDAFELQLFKLEQTIRQQAHFLPVANNYQGFVQEQWVMSKEELAASFKSIKLWAARSSSLAGLHSQPPARRAQLRAAQRAAAAAPQTRRGNLSPSYARRGPART